MPLPCADEAEAIRQARQTPRRDRPLLMTAAADTDHRTERAA